VCGRDGHFAGPPAEVEGADDREILAHAQKLTNAFGLEIWDHKRFVARIPPPRTGVVLTLWAVDKFGRAIATPRRPG
jgi:hypothetical protein